jgi:hypothetical protein
MERTPRVFHRCAAISREFVFRLQLIIPGFVNDASLPVDPMALPARQGDKA